MRPLLRLGVLLLGTLPGSAAFGQAPLPAGAITPDALSRFCAPQGSASCAVLLAGAYTLALSGDWHLPRSMHLRFAPGSTLRVSGGVLHFDGGAVEAPPSEAIFPAADSVRGLAAARPEWFAPTDSAAAQGPIPASALAQAYEATEEWGTVYLQAREYVSPFSGCPPATLRYLSPRTLVGAGRPVPDDLTEPTHLQNGTVLLGGIAGTAPIRLAHLGIDAGPRASVDVLHGCQPPGVFIEQPNHQFVSGDRLEDVSVLTTGAFNMHSVMIAGHQGAEVRDLWIWTLGGTHGLVMKSSHSVVDGLHCWGAVSDCLIVKSDYATDFLGRADHDRIAHVEIHPLRPGGYVGGIVVESRWDTVHSIDIDDVDETGTEYGLTVLGSTFYRPHDITVSHWKADAVSAFCLYADRADRITVSDLHCRLRPTAWTGVLLDSSTGIILQHTSLLCGGDATECAAGRTNGISNDASTTSFSDVTLDGLGGYALHRSRSSESTAGLQTVHMEGRLLAPDQEPWQNRAGKFRAEFKPNVRILYTTALTRVQYRPWLYSMLAALVALITAWEVVHRRQRRFLPKRLRRA